MTDQIEYEDEVEASSAPLVEHLAELRTRLVRCVIAFVVAILLVFTVANPILEFIMQPITRALNRFGQDATLIFTAPHEYFFALFRIAMIFGFFVSFPIMAHQLWRFVAPGLYSHEKGAFLPFLIASPLLFIAGAAFAHFAVTPLAMNFFIGFADFVQTGGPLGTAGETPDAETKFSVLPAVRESLSLSMKFIFAFGICFQLPVLMTLLGKAGMVSGDGLRDMRKYAVVAILTLAAIVTPPDVITQVILFTVVYALYEGSILLVDMVERKREQDLKAEGLWDEELHGKPKDDD